MFELMEVVTRAIGRLKSPVGNWRPEGVTVESVELVLVGAGRVKYLGAVVVSAYSPLWWSQLPAADSEVATEELETLTELWLLW